MSDNHHRIVAILIKFAQKRRLKRSEARFLKDWMEQSDGHRRLPETLRSGNWQEDLQRQLDRAPSPAEMWANIRRSLEGSGVVYRMRRPMPVVGYWLTAVLALIFVGGDLFYGVPGRRRVGQEYREKGNGVLTERAGRNVQLSIVPVDGVVSGGGGQALPKLNTSATPDSAGGVAQRRLETRTPRALETRVPRAVEREAAGILQKCVAIGKSCLPYPLRMPDGNSMLLRDSVRVGTGEDAIATTGHPKLQPMAGDSTTTAGPAASMGFHFDNTEFEPALRQVADCYGLKISWLAHSKGTTLVADLPQLSSPDRVVAILNLLERGFVQIRIEQNVLIVSDWHKTK